MSQGSRKYLKVFVSLFLVLGLAAYFFSSKGLSFQEVLKAFGQFTLSSLVMALFLVMLQNFFMAFRVWILFPKEARISLGTALHGVFYGQAVNTFIPARAGDVLKAVIFSKDLPSGISSQGSSPPVMLSAGVLVADKIVDILGLILLIVLTGSYQIYSPENSLSSLASWTTGLILLGLGISFLLLKFVFKEKLEKALQWWDGFKKGLTGVFEWKRAFFSLLVALLAWMSEAITLQVLCQGQGFSLNLTQSVFLLSVLNLAIAIPISIANLGPFEAAIVFGLGKLGVNATSSVAIAAAHHSLQMIGLLSLTGLVAVYRMFKVLGNSKSIEQSEFRVKLDDKKKAIDYFDKVSANYNETVSKGILRIPRERERKAVLDFASLDLPGGTLIDVGCGAGFYSLCAKKAGMNVHSVDMSPGMVKRLEGLVDKAEVADVETIPTQQKYDRVICAGVLDFVLKPEAAFTNLCQLVSPKGRLIVLCPRKGPGGLFYRVEKFFFGIRINLYTKEWLSEIATQHGLTLSAHTHPLPTNMALLFTRS